MVSSRRRPVPDRDQLPPVRAISRRWRIHAYRISRFVRSPGATGATLLSDDSQRIGGTSLSTLEERVRDSSPLAIRSLSVSGELIHLANPPTS
jgi:hypothetical protein